MWAITSPDGETIEFRGDARVDATGRVVTFDWLQGGEAYDVVAGETVDGVPRCWVADATGDDWVLACVGRHRVPTLETLSGEVLVGEAEWRDLYARAGWEWSDDEPFVGHIQGVIPFRGSWLVGWSGECESADALWMRPGQVDHVTGLDWETAPSALAGGWTSDGEMVFTEAGFGFGCEQVAETPGVYMARPGSSPVLLWDSGGRNAGVRVWHRPRQP